MSQADPMSEAPSTPCCAGRGVALLLLAAGLTCLLGALAVAGGLAALMLGDRVEGQPPGDCAAGDVIAFPSSALRR
jgi:hypothetical protein